jgi:mannonate dehydratase
MSEPSTETAIDSREFDRVTHGALGAAAVAGQSAQTTAQKSAPTMKLCGQSSPTFGCFSAFLKQLGAEFVSVGSTPDGRGLHQIKRYANAGITVWNIGNTSVQHAQVALNLPGRDQKIEEYKQYLRNLGKAGIRARPTRIWATASGPAAARRVRGAPH